MATVDTGVAAYLKSDALVTSVTPVGVAWGDRGFDFELTTPIDARFPAISAANRFAGFMGGPLAKDAVEVIGGRQDLLGKVVGLTGDRLGYTSTATAALVIGVAETEAGTSILTVLRRLGPFVADPEAPPAGSNAVVSNGVAVTYNGEPVTFTP